jgi:hypothetical protein
VGFDEHVEVDAIAARGSDRIASARAADRVLDPVRLTR